MKVTFVSSAGQRREIDASGGLSLVEVAIEHDIEEIEAECGGACSCATCHIMIAADWVAKIAPPRTNESEMLELLEDRRTPNSRLACQVVLNDSMDGLTVHTPAEQG